MNEGKFESAQNGSDAVTKFEKKPYKEGCTAYIFDHVAVAIDTSGKNQKEYPELLFGTFDEKPDEDTMRQPGMRREGVDMEYVSRCIQEVVRDSGVHEFWFYPFGDDDSDDTEKRKQARLRLFSRFGTITPAESGHGYVLSA